jgi:hypothetical protein
MSSNKLDSITNLLSDDDKTIIARIYETVANYQSFTKKVAFPLILSNKISESSTTKNNIEVFLSLLISNANGAKDIKQLHSGIESVMNLNVIPTNQTVLERLLFLDANNFVDKVIDKFKTVIEPIGPADDIPREYSENMQSICTHVYYVLYQQLYSALQNTGSSYSTYFPYMSLSSIESICNNLSKGILTNIAFYPKTDTLDDYIKKCYQLINDSTVNTFIATANAVNREIFALAFLPFFAMSYVLSFIATPNIEAVNKAPRNAIIRRIAIQSVYEIQLYVIYAVYMLSAKYSPNSAETYGLRMILDTSVTQVFDKESSYVDSEEAFKYMHQSTKNAFDKNDKLRDISNDIDASNNSYISIQENEASLDKQLKNSKVVYWVWLVILITYITYFLIVLFVSKPVFKDVYVILGMILLLIVVIIGIAAVSRTKY